MKRQALLPSQDPGESFTWTSCPFIALVNGVSTTTPLQCPKDEHSYNDRTSQGMIQPDQKRGPDEDWNQLLRHGLDPELQGRQLKTVLSDYSHRRSWYSTKRRDKQLPNRLIEKVERTIFIEKRTANEKLVYNIRKSLDAPIALLAELNIPPFIIYKKTAACKDT